MTQKNVISDRRKIPRPNQMAAPEIYFENTESKFHMSLCKVESKTSISEIFFGMCDIEPQYVQITKRRGRKNCNQGTGLPEYEMTLLNYFDDLFHIGKSCTKFAKKSVFVGTESNIHEKNPYFFVHS